MKLVYTHENPLLVANVKNLLEQQGIAVILKNEFARGAMGEISTLDTWPELWITSDDDYAHALEIVKSNTNSGSTNHWTCAFCSEENDSSFDLCWNCQKMRPD